MRASRKDTAQAGTGTYILLLRLSEPSRIQVGKHGTHDFPTGYYTYTGSAMGPGGLRARVARHLRKDKRRHWHIDYLIEKTTIIGVRVEESSQRLECVWNANLQAQKGAVIMPGFGSSDCSCVTHLLYFKDVPDLKCFGLPLSLASQ